MSDSVRTAPESLEAPLDMPSSAEHDSAADSSNSGGDAEPSSSSRHLRIVRQPLADEDDGDLEGSGQSDMPRSATGSNSRIRFATDEMPTVISQRSLLGAGTLPTQSSRINRGGAASPASPMSESAVRILNGRILPGETLGHFELLQYVGGGGMGKVFRALDTRLARHVALKILAPEQAFDNETVLRFQNEAQSAARLDHENIARVHYVGEDRGLHFIAFEFIDGVNVRDLVESRGPLPLAEAAAYALQVADALAHASSRNVVHRDIKPSNLIITPNNQAKLIDMGLARLREGNHPAMELTASGVTLGTFDYISPEQARDPRNADVRSDIYSLGCTWFFMLTGRPPFLGGTVLQKLLQHQADTPPDVRQLRPDLPEEASRILRKMLAKEPKRRYGSAEELVSDLLGLAQAAGLSVAAPSGRAWMLPAQRPAPAYYRHLPWIVSLVSLLAIVALLDRLWDYMPSPAPAAFGPAESDRSPPTSAANNFPQNVPPHAMSPLGAPSSSVFSQGTGLPPSGFDVPSAGSPDSAGSAALPPSIGPALSNSATVDSEAPIAPHDSGSGSSAKSSDDPAPPSRPDASRDSIFGADRIDGILTAPPVVAPNYAPLDFTGSAAVDSAPFNRPVLTLPFNPKLPVDSAPAAAAARSGMLVVCPQPAGADQYATLQAACNAAAAGDVIELRYNGVRDEPPVKVAVARLTIRAGEGFAPQLRFKPADVETGKAPRAMISVTSGRLTLVRLGLEMIVPRDIPAENWSLLEIHGSQALRLEKCELTVSNASMQHDSYHRDVAFVRVHSVPDSDIDLEADSPAALASAEIDLTDCFARGEATFVRSEDLQPIHVNWDNGLLATSERLLAASGGSRAVQPGESIEFDLRHVTAVVRQGVMLLGASRTEPRQLSVKVTCSDCLFAGGTGSTLVEQLGDEPLSEMRERVSWTADRNEYAGFESFWAIRRLDGDMPVDSMSFDAWRGYWSDGRENLTHYGAISWRRPLSDDRSAHESQAADFALTATDENAGRAAASDGHDLGAVIERLPSE